MSTPADPVAIRPVVLQGQIIVGALIAGVLMFLAITTLVDLEPKPVAGAVAGNGAGAQRGGQQSRAVPIVTYAALMVGAVLLPASFLVPGLVAKQQRRAIAAGKVIPGTHPALTPGSKPEAAASPAGGLAAAFLTQLIIGAAMNEGAAFFAGVAYLIEKNPIALAMALVLVAGLIARFPTASRVERWIEQQLEKLHDDQLDALAS